MNMKKKDPESTEMTFFEHIDALRPHLVRGVMAIGVIGLVAFFCKSFIIDTVLFGPQSPDFPTNRMLTWRQKVCKKRRQKPMVSGLPFLSRVAFVMGRKGNRLCNKPAAAPSQVKGRVGLPLGEYGSPRPVCGLVSE